MAHEVFVRGVNRATINRLGYGANARKIGNSAVVVDLDDGNARRVLQGQRHRLFVVPEQVIPLQRAGGLATATTASGLVYVAPRAQKLYRVFAQVGTAPAGASILLDVHRVAAGGATTAAGTTVFTDQARRPAIAAGTTASSMTSTTVGVPQVTDLAAGDILRVEIDQVGSGTAGSDLVVQFVLY